MDCASLETSFDPSGLCFSVAVVITVSGGSDLLTALLPLPLSRPPRSYALGILGSFLSESHSGPSHGMPGRNTEDPMSGYLGMYTTERDPVDENKAQRQEVIPTLTQTSVSIETGKHGPR